MNAELLSYPAYKSSRGEWFREIPAHWAAISVKRHFEIQLGKMLQPQPNSPDDVQVPYLKAQHVQWNDVLIEDPPVMWASRKDIEQFGIAQGDLLVCEGGEGGRSGILRSVTNGYIIQNALHRVRSKAKAKNEYLFYSMQAVSFSGWFEAINNKATIAHFTKEKFGDLTIPLPPLSEQVAIVRYLDQADSHIRSYTSAKERLIELLTEQKQAVINQAVTRGLDPNVPLKPSAVDWLDEMPAHWEIMPIKRAFSSMDYGISESATDSGSIRLITMGHVSEGRVTVPHSGGVDAVSENLLLQDGDLLFNRTNSQELVGKVGLFEDHETPVTYASYLVRLRPTSHHNSDYLNAVLNDAKVLSIVRREAIPSLHQSNLNPTRYGRIRIPLPRLNEQVAIMKYLKRVTEEIDAGINRAHRQIELVQEYRTRLIADVVTGKLDVRGVVADEIEMPTP